MCLMVYLAADRPLEMVAWNDSTPGFYVEALAAEEDRVRRNFRKPHVVYAGSHEGCGCGFRSRRRSLEELGRYLRREVARVGAIELLACRDGAQARRPATRRTLTPAAFDADGFAFADSELAVVDGS